jgi:hypothetical protein
MRSSRAVRRWSLIACALGALLATPASAQECLGDARCAGLDPVPPADPPAAAELTRLLKEFLEGASRNDAAVHDRFWSEDLVYTGAAGKRRGKAELMNDVRTAPSPKPGASTAYTAEDVRIRQYGHTAVVAFRLVGTTTAEGRTEVAHYLNTGTFVRREGRWQAVAWQATRAADPPAAPKK